MASRRTRLWLAALVAGALVVRLLVVWRANHEAPAGAARLVGDEPQYDGLARGLLDGRWFDYPARMPLYPAFVAAVYAVTGRSVDALLYVQALAGAGTVLLAWLLARRLFGEPAAWVAGILTAVHWALVLQSTRVLTEILSTPALLLATLALVAALDEPSPRRFAIAGAAFAGATYVRPVTAGMPLVVVAILLLRRVPARRLVAHAGAFTAALVVLLAPWSVSQTLRYDAFLPLTTTTSVVWQGSPEYWDLMEDGRSYPSIWQQELNPARNGGYVPGTVDGDRHLDRVGWESIRDRPATYAWYSTLKVAYFWLGHPSADWYGGRYLDPRVLHAYWPWWEVALIMAARLTPLAGLAAALVLWRDWRRLLPVHALLAWFTLVHALTWAEIRLSEPLAPFWLLLVAGAAVRLAGGRRAAGPAAAEPGIMAR